MIYSKIFRLFFTVVVFWIDSAKGARCSFEATLYNVNLGKLPLAYTLDSYLKPYIIYPGADGHFEIDSNKKITLSCVNRVFQYNYYQGYRDVQVTCVGGTTYRYYGSNYDFSEFECSGYIQTDSRVSTKLCQPNNNTVVDVGFKVRGYFFPLYYVCFDQRNLNTLYTWYKVRIPFTGNFQNYNRTEYFQSSLHGNLSTHDQYKIDIQRGTINGILNLPLNSNLYIDNKEHFLSKGHFIPRTDFYFAREQAATFNYLNILPHWNKCNMTWREIEKVVRIGLKDDATSKRVIVTGVYGTATLPFSPNVQRFLYLVMPARQIAVPKFVWKIVYDVKRPRRSVVYIAYNNRTTEAQTNVTRDLQCTVVQCPGTINNRVALDWIDNGLIYCCDVTSFQNVYVKFSSDVFTAAPDAVPER